MCKHLLYIAFFVCTLQQFHSQEDGVVAFELPVRNSLKFNRYAINPAFSFVREQNRYISFTNKRQWVQFDDAPQTYLFSYSGRFRENIGAGIGLFQQDYGVLSTFGGILNFAYNVSLNRESNLTFGMNLGFYKSGINEGRVVSNFQDPSLNNIPSNSIITINPGINYGTDFFDFGLSINNLATYNFTTSAMIEDNPQQSVQGHIMYTGYMNTRGFFNQSKFSTLIRSEFKKGETVISGIVMLTVPKGIWAQAGYNTLYGASAGVGLNITQQIALEYNYEKALGDFANFGSSHELTLAYKFKKNYRYNYGDDDEEEALIMPSKKSNRVLAKSTPNKYKNLPRKKRVSRVTKEVVESLPKADTISVANKVTKVEPEKPKEKTEEELIEEQRLAAIEVLAKKRKEEEKLKAEAEAKAKHDAIAKQKADEAARIKAEQEEKVRLARVAKQKAAAEAKAKREQEEAARLKAEQVVKEKFAEQARVKALENERARLAEEARLKAEQEAQAQKDKEVQPEIVAEEIIGMINLDGVMVPAPRDRETREMNGITVLTNNSKLEQQDLLTQLQQKIASKQKDLDDLKEENDLSEQGIYSAPKAFKSISAENAAMAAIQLNLDNVIKSRDLNIKELETLYNERLKTVRDKRDVTNQYYANKIQELKSEQAQAIKTRSSLLANLETIKVATEIERKRRIKRAAFDNDQVRYQKDRAALKQIKEYTPISSEPLKPENFDSGEVLSNIQILKDVNNVENGYYIVVAVHSSIEKRDEFLRKAVAAGQSNIDFFFDINTSKYYIYYQKFNSIDAANQSLNSKGSEPYNVNMSMVKIEN
ncbi:PorP/SprF family type IX secretion system membrane protein [uncultured Algibacter sp.]|uniref:PorP/SprF family type IX secretion system membrane protein n=1 Tax=uncultured Algibacter sp. TaxID=298659 RepID=UPI002618E7A1|nr:PorP/SprF family type IX secretion system membrane protein [uncultured Algibacter sp.]